MGTGGPGGSSDCLLPCRHMTRSWGLQFRLLWPPVGWKPIDPIRMGHDALPLIPFSWPADPLPDNQKFSCIVYVILCVCAYVCLAKCFLCSWCSLLSLVFLVFLCVRVFVCVGVLLTDDPRLGVV